MADYPTTLAIIPARSGSKGLPGKNIAPCAGKPLIHWTIEAASQCKYIDKVLVSTDAEEIADVAVAGGAWAPFLRSADLAQDDSSILDVVKEVLVRLSDQYRPDLVVLLQPTSPLRDAQHLNQAFQRYFTQRETDLNTMVSVSQVDSKILWALGVDKQSGYAYSHFGLDLTNPRRQALADCYLPNGAIYIAPAKNFSGFYGPNIIPYQMDEMSSLDVDYQEDLDRAIEHLSRQST